MDQQIPSLPPADPLLILRHCTDYCEDAKAELAEWIQSSGATFDLLCDNTWAANHPPPQPLPPLQDLLRLVKEARDARDYLVAKMSSETVHVIVPNPASDSLKAFAEQNGCKRILFE